MLASARAKASKENDGALGRAWLLWGQLAEPGLLDNLAFLSERLPPTLHLVLAGRAEPPLPLARWRARGDLGEIRQIDLCFTISETIESIQKTGGLQLTGAEAAALAGRTEGWAAGLQMAAISLRGLQEAAGFIQDFTGSNRYVGDYLTEEVLRRQPEEVQAFLLRTSILDRLSGPLCDFLLEEEEGKEPVGSERDLQPQIGNHRKDAALSGSEGLARAEDRWLYADGLDLCLALGR